MAKQKTHYDNSRAHGARRGWALCSAKVVAETDRDPERVTCLACLRKLPTDANGVVTRPAE
jgi:hypothetical protein